MLVHLIAVRRGVVFEQLFNTSNIIDTNGLKLTARNNHRMNIVATRIKFIGSALYIVKINSRMLPMHWRATSSSTI